MTPKESALRAVQGLPDDCTWDDVLREVAEREQAVNDAQEGGMRQTYDVVVERDEDGYFVGSVPGLPGCHTQAKTLDQLLERIREAIQLCLDVSEPEQTEFIGIRRVTVTA